MPDAVRYLLSDESSRHRFHKRILLKELPARTGPSARPTAAITGGQPGSGKSKLITTLRDRFGENQAIPISGDDLRRYHPEYRRLLREDPHNAAFYTDRDAGRWVEMLIEAASDRCLDLVIESTMRSVETFRKTASLLRAKGYAIEAHAVAVRPSLSWLGVHLRYEEAIRVAGHGRFTIRASHDAALAGLPATLAAILNEALAANISVWERGATSAAFTTNRNPDGTWTNPERPEHWLARFWARSAEPADLADLRAGWEHVLQRMRQRGAAATEIAACETVAQAEIDRERQEACWPRVGPSKAANAPPFTRCR